MTHWLTIWRAAQLVGVTRGALQEQVRTGALALDDGRVSTANLLALYPHARLEEHGMLERVATIRDEAFGKRVRERLLPSQEVLAQRLFHQTQELADLRLHLQRYHAVLMQVRERIHQEATAQPQAQEWRELKAMTDQGLAQALATEPADALTVMDDMIKVMTARVRVRPSGHEFSVEGHDTLLQAGLRAGLKLNYGCGNGTCGMCKVRVIEGQVTRTQACDYPLSEAERAQGYTLMCAHTAASSDITLEMLEASGPQDIPVQEIVAQVRSVKPLDANTMLLHLQTPRSHRLRFLAGQSVQLGVAGRAGQDLQGQYPVASCPCDDRNLHFFVGRQAHDTLAEHLWAGALKAGDAVRVSGPMGSFVLAESSRPLVFAACDLGIAPVKSLIEHALALEAAPSISLYWLATGGQGHFIVNQCRAWSQALDHFEYALFDAERAAPGGHDVAQAIRADLFDIGCDYYLAGPPEFVQAMQAELRQAGVALAQVHSLELESPVGMSA